MNEEERRALAERERLQREEQERTDELVRSWVRVPMPSTGERTDWPGPVARPDGLSFSTMLVRSIREDAREADWVASTQAVDSYDTIIQQDWDGPHRGLDRYRANPVVLFAHDSWALPIGRATKIGVENPDTEAAALVTTVKFATAKANPMAEYCWQSVLEKTLRGMSVGWRPGAWERREVDGVMRSVAVRNTLYEQSVCPVPSNPEALQRAMEAMQRAAGARLFSFPSQPEQRAMPTQTPAAPPAPSKEQRMKTLIIDNLQADTIRRLGAADIKEGDETVRVCMPHLSNIDAEVRAANDKAAAAEKRAAELATERDALATRVKDAEERATKAVQDKEAAEKARDAAIAERAAVELEPLTGLEPWQFTPAERTHVASLAATSPETYRSMLAERRKRGEEAGALPRQEPNGHLPTRQAAPAPKSGAPAAGSALFARAERDIDTRGADAPADAN